jgi:hypothetical protein
MRRELGSVAHLDAQMADDADEQGLQREQNRGWHAPDDYVPRLIQETRSCRGHGNISEAWSIGVSRRYSGTRRDCRASAAASYSIASELVAALLVCRARHT